MYCIRNVAPTLAALFGLAPFTDAQPMEEVRSLVKNGRAERVLMYNPDAVAWWIYEKYAPRFAPAMETNPLVLNMRSVMPSVTPVCFASMYTGLMPEDHGIQSYTKPVLRVKTIFDALLGAGLKPAICSTGTDSVSVIFQEREMDYFLFDTPEEVNAKAEELIRADRHDLVVAYNGNYDGTMHRWGPEAEESLAALSMNAESYRRLCGAAKEAWAGKSWAAAFATDHGCHEIDGGCGSHGLDMPEDMQVVHLWTSGERMREEGRRMRGEVRSKK